MWLYTSRGRRLIDERVSDERVRSRTIRYWPGVPLYLVGIGLAFINTWAAISWWGLLAAFYVIPPRD